MNEGLDDPTDLEKQWTKRRNKGKVSLSIRENEHDGTEYLPGDPVLDELGKKVDELHKYVFVGRTGAFVPVKAGVGGGHLMRVLGTQDEMLEQGYPKFKTYAYATGSKGYRWLETEKVIEEHLQDAVDMSYYAKLAADAKKHIEEAGEYSFEQFVGTGPLVKDPLDLYSDELPF